jgi:cystathionine beta-lyase/cystathionine gamma-synthase
MKVLSRYVRQPCSFASGLAAVKDEELGNQLYKLQNSFGAVLGVQDCWLDFVAL